MAKRVELNEQSLDKVVGGAFSFYEDVDGNSKCYVTNYGEFDTTADGFFDYINMRNEQPGLSEDEYVAIAKQKGIIW